MKKKDGQSLSTAIDKSQTETGDVGDVQRLENALQFTKSFKRLARLRKHKEGNKDE